jgi:hypothetical protein
MKNSRYNRKSKLFVFIFTCNDEPLWKGEGRCTVAHNQRNFLFETSETTRDGELVNAFY